MPHHRMLITTLLNPYSNTSPASEESDNSPTDVDIRGALMQLLQREPHAPISAPPYVLSWIINAATDVDAVLSAQPPRIQAANSNPPSHVHESQASSVGSCHIPEVRVDVRLNNKTTLSKLITYHDTGAYVEYPETNTQDPVGYLFKRDVKAWWNPSRAFVYSLGVPSGRSTKDVFSGLLVDSSGSSVPCIKRHMTCQGSKLCSAADMAKWSTPHYTATPQDISARLRHERDFISGISDPSYEVFQKTAALISAVRKVGCRAPKYETTGMNAVELEAYTALLNHQSDLSRGYTPQEERCDGRIVLEFDQSDKPLIRCEHYVRKRNRDHFIQFLDDGYNIDYLDAYFHEDFEELERIEEGVKELGYGPLADCSTIVNFTSQRMHCPRDHRDEGQQLAQLKLSHLKCEVKVVVYEPLPEYRDDCPWILITCRGAHTHPLPVPQKTPPLIRSELEGLLKSLDTDLADLTPRRFIRHPITKNYLRNRFPSVIQPSLCDLHISLANRSHLKHYIDKIKTELFPAGTGIEGTRLLKKYQDTNLPLEEHYVRRILEISHTEIHDEDEPEDVPRTAEKLQIVVCMTKEQSRRMKRDGQYMQSDIGFKRVVGFYEFELACMDRRSNTSVTFCRVFLNRQTAFAHQNVFAMIEEVFCEDTGTKIQWRHIHASNMNETDGMILQWTGDQHGGQAKGLGLHLQTVAKQFPDKYDLDEPHRLLVSLSPYEHLHRLFRLCVIHVLRNIRKLSLSEAIKNTMRGLLCMEHSNWDAAIKSITESGEKGAIDWVNDKLRSKFALEAMCWERSRIPEMVWKAGDKNSNVVEEIHADVNREGIHCTLVGGIKKGQAFDNLKMTTLQAAEQAGIRPSYLAGHISENTTKNLKRKFAAHHRALEGQDSKIELHNSKLQRLHGSLTAAQEAVYIAMGNFALCDPIQNLRQHQEASERVGKEQDKLGRCKIAFTKQVNTGLSLQGTGSGKVGIFLPASPEATDE